MPMKKRKKYCLFAILFCASFSSFGCVGFYMPALVNAPSPKETVTINSTPRGATVFMDGKSMGVTPCSIDIARDESPKISLSLRGFEPVRFELEKIDRDEFGSGEAIFGLVFWSVAGCCFLAPWLGIDWVIWTECNDYRFSPNAYNVRLIKQVASPDL